MDNLVNIAIIGTGQAAAIPFTTDLPTDALLEPHSAENRERLLLLAAGSASIYRRAAYVPALFPESLPAAEPEDQSYCSLRIEQYLENLLKETPPGEVLLETLQLMGQAHLLLPARLLPLALHIKKSHAIHRAHIYPLLGKRGLWLSQFQAEWAWAQHYNEQESASLIQNVESVWQEGTLEQRTEVLLQMRSINSERARNWLASAWPQERLQARNALLATLEQNLTLADEDFLEHALDDRNADIQKRAATLLAQLPASAFSQRMQNRAETLLFYQDERIKIAIPATMDSFWKHDGLEESTYIDLQGSVHWIIQILERVPLTFWEKRFSSQPDQLVNTIKNSAEDQIVMIGWCKAALHIPNSTWILSLWRWWNQIGKQEQPDNWAYPSLYSLQQDIHLPSLLKKISPQECENLVTYNIEHEESWQNLIGNLPKPWSTTFSNLFLQKFGEHLPKENETHIYSYQTPWYHTLIKAATAIPPECFSIALEICQPLTIKGMHIYEQRTWNNQLEQFRDIITMRQQIREELQG